MNVQSISGPDIVKNSMDYSGSNSINKTENQPVEKSQPVKEVNKGNSVDTYA